MQVLIRLLVFLTQLLGALLLGWIRAIPTLCARIRAIFARQRDQRRLPGRLQKTSPNHCVPISDPAYKRPDPLIYDQYYLMAQGLAVTWINPDIQILQRDSHGHASVVDAHHLSADTDYEVVARIWNGSTEAPIVDLPVRFDYLSFGIGTQLNLIGSVAVDLGVKGGPDMPAYASIPWRTPPSAGHYCIQASFAWADDSNPNNNLGQHNTQVLLAHSPATGRFALLNPGPSDDVFDFQFDSYSPPRPTPCAERPTRMIVARSGARVAPGTIHWIPPEHDPHEYPVPPGWTVSLFPSTPALGAGEAIDIRIVVEPPATFTGSQILNVHAIGRKSGLLGGVTFTIESQ